VGYLPRGEKLEQHGEELVDLLLKAARAGEWRVVTMMLDRVFGRPKETVAVEREESEVERLLKGLTRERSSTPSCTGRIAHCRHCGQ
jgi:hypothetical protein